MTIHATFEFVTGGGNQGEFVSNAQMIKVVKDYIYQETGEKVDIADPGLNAREKGLLLMAYSWAVDHLHY